jgi:tetratricopeptide (TPR) repeat protein
MGNVEKAVLLAEESVALDRKTGNTIHLPMSLDSLGYVYQALGEWEKSRKYYDEAFNIAQKLNDFQAIGFSYGHLGYFHLDKGEFTKAREFYKKAYEVCEKAGTKLFQAWCSHAIIWTSIELGEIEKIENQIDRLHSVALELKDKELIANADRLRAMLFRVQKKWEESIEYFEKSLQQFEVLNAGRWNVYWLAKFVLYEYARVYLERDQPGDREKAHNLLNQALEIFQKMGAKKDIEKIIATKKLLTA